VLAADVDGMADVLPDECRFRPGNAQDMADRLRALREKATPALLDRLAGLIETRFNAQTFADRFAERLLRDLAKWQAGRRAGLPADGP